MRVSLTPRDVPLETFRMLGERCRLIGLSRAIDDALSTCPGTFEAAARPLRAWHLARRGTPGAHAARLFVLRDALELEPARQALGDALLEALLDAELLTFVGPRAIRSVLRVFALDETLVFADDTDVSARRDLRSQLVMGLGPRTTTLVRAALPVPPGARVLDLGCGAGIVALALADHGANVVATDVNPRAVALARANGAALQLPRDGELDVRQGDLFAPVAGEKFDRILVQPPFLPRRAGEPPLVYAHGGARGDELALRVLRELGPHLALGGRALVIVDWPLGARDDVCDIVRAAAGPGFDVVVVEAADEDLDQVCAGNAATEHESFGPRYAEDVVARRAHLETLGITRMKPTLVAIEPAEGRGVVHRVGVDDLDEIAGADTLDRMFLAARLLA